MYLNSKMSANMVLMKCPKCNKEGAKYKVRSSRKIKGSGKIKSIKTRCDYSMKCGRCGYEGTSY